MPPDTIQIGPLLISRVVFDVIATLLSVIVGGLITYLTTRTIESKKWEQQKKDKLQEQRRDAIGLALEWLVPIDIALVQGSANAMAFLNKEIDIEAFMRNWPDLSLNIARIDIPARLRVLLPSNIYGLTGEIILQLSNLKFATYRSNPSYAGSPEDWAKSLKITNDQIKNIRKLVDTLRTELVEEYEKTFK